MKTKFLGILVSLLLGVASLSAQVLFPGGLPVNPTPPTLNGILYGNGTKTLQVTAAGGAGTLCLVETAGGTPAFGSCSGSSSTAWSAVTSGTNSSAGSLLVGTGSSLSPTGTGVIEANEVTSAAVLGTAAQITATNSGGVTTLSLPSTTTTTILNATTGFQINGAAPSGHCFLGNGSDYVDSSACGTVTSFSAGNLSPLFTSSVATATSTPALTFTLTNAAGLSWFGNASGSSGAPSYNTTPLPFTMGGTGLSTITASQCIQGNSGGTALVYGTCGGGGGSSAFGSLTSGTNTTAAMLVGSGATLEPTTSTPGTISANALTSIPLSTGTVYGQDVYVCPTGCAYSGLSAAFTAQQATSGPAQPWIIHDDVCNETFSTDVFAITLKPYDLWAPTCNGQPWITANAAQHMRGSSQHIHGAGASMVAGAASSKIILGASFPLPVPQAPPTPTASFVASATCTPGGSFTATHTYFIEFVYTNAAGPTEASNEQSVTATSGNLCLSVPEPTGVQGEINWAVYITPDTSRTSTFERFAGVFAKGSGTELISAPPTPASKYGPSHANLTAALFTVGEDQATNNGTLAQTFNSYIQDVPFFCNGGYGSVAAVLDGAQELSGLFRVEAADCGGVNPTTGTTGGSSNNLTIGATTYTCATGIGSQCFTNNAGFVAEGNTNTIGANNSSFVGLAYNDSQCPTTACTGMTTTTGGASILTAVQPTYCIVIDNVQAMRWDPQDFTCTPNTSATANVTQWGTLVTGAAGNNVYQSGIYGPLHIEGVTGASGIQGDVILQSSSGLFLHENGCNGTNCHVSEWDASSFNVVVIDSSAGTNTVCPLDDLVDSIGCGGSFDSGTGIAAGSRVGFFASGDKANTFVSPYMASFFPMSGTTHVALAVHGDANSSNIENIYQNGGQLTDWFDTNGNLTLNTEGAFSGSGATGLELQLQSDEPFFVVGGGSSPANDIFQVWAQGSTTNAICSASTTGCAFAIKANKTAYLFGNVLNVGATGQSQQTQINAFGSTTSSNLAPGYYTDCKEDGSHCSFLMGSTTFAGDWWAASGAPSTDVAAANVSFGGKGASKYETTGASGTVGLLQSFSATDTTIDAPSNSTAFIGVAEATGNGLTRIKYSGETTVNIPSSTTAAGDYICSSTLTAGVTNAIDNGSTKCPSGQMVGIATQTQGSAQTSVRVQLTPTPGQQGSTTRTWRFDYLGVCQSGAASAPVNFGTVNAPLYVACSSTQATPQWQIPATDTSSGCSSGTVAACTWSFWVRIIVPPGVTSGTTAYTLTSTYNTTDTTTSDAATMQPYYACVAAGSSSANPSITSVGSTQSFPGTTTQVDTTVTGTITPTCSAGNTLFIQWTFSANTLAQALNFSYVGVTVTGSL